MKDDALREAHAARIRQSYDEYVQYKKQVRDEIKEEIERVAEARIEAARVSLSRELHGAHDAGVPKHLLKRAVRAYTNVGPWRELWDAAEYTPGNTEVSTSTVKQFFKILTADPADQGAKFIEAGKKAVLRVFSGPDAVAWEAPVDVPLERQRMQGPWIVDGEWYGADENGDVTLLPGFERLAQWGDTHEEAVARVLRELR